MKKILVINNDFDTMSLLKNWLEKKGFEVTFSGNRKEVVSIIKEFKPQLLIVDILQNAILDDIKTNKYSSTLPVLLMTGYTLRRYGKHFPGDDTIEKPFDLNLLERKINDLMNTSEVV